MHSELACLSCMPTGKSRIADHALHGLQGRQSGAARNQTDKSRSAPTLQTAPGAGPSLMNLTLLEVAQLRQPSYHKQIRSVSHYTVCPTNRRISVHPLDRAGTLLLRSCMPCGAHHNKLSLRMNVPSGAARTRLAALTS
jgi:hypothetical protein